MKIIRSSTDKWIPWWEPILGQREKDLVCEVIDKNFPNDGEYTALFELQVAQLVNARFAVATTSGTSAIFLALAAAGVGEGDEVIVPDITFIATANAVRLTGARPVLVDVRTDDFNIDPECVAAAITSRTRAIVPVHVSGRAAPITELMELAKVHGLYVIEDAAEAFGSRYEGRPLGAIGHAGCFSFSPNKTITTGQGGMVVTNDETIHRRLRELKDQGRPLRGTGGDDEHLSVGYNFKLTNLQAAVGLAQIEKFPDRRKKLRSFYEIYAERLAFIPQIRLPSFDLDGGECPQWTDAYINGRNALHDFLLERRIQSRKFWFPIHTQTPYRDSGERFSRSLAVSANALWLPSSLSLDAEDIATVCKVIRQWARC